METKYKKFKPFDKVLMRINTAAIWECDFYSYYEEGYKYPHRTLSYRVKDENILPYEGNEHLVGTTDEPEEEIKLEEGEWVIGLSNITDFQNLLRHGSVGVFQGLMYPYADSAEKKFCINHVVTKYAIRFHDFNPSDMEETKKHILCVKNGKVVKYKE